MTGISGSGDNPGQASGACVNPSCGAKTDAYLCSHCWTELEAAINDLPPLVNDLATVSLRQTRVYRANDRRPRPDEELAELEEEYAHRMRAIPARLRSRDGRMALPQTQQVADLGAAIWLDEAHSTLTTWARHLTEVRGARLVLTTGPTQGPTCTPHVHDFTAATDEHPAGCGHAVDDAGNYSCRRLHCYHASCNRIRHGELTGVATALCRWFVRHRESVRYDEAAESFYSDVMNLRERLWRVVDASPSPIYVGPCRAVVDDRCCARDLYRWPDRKEIICDGYRSDDLGCGTVHVQTDRDDWLVAQLQDALIGIPEMLAALPTLFKTYPQPPRSVVHAWVRQGRLVAHGRNHVGEPTFLGADLLELISAYKPHKFATRRRRAA